MFPSGGLFHNTVQLSSVRALLCASTLIFDTDNPQNHFPPADCPNISSKRIHLVLGHDNKIDCFSGIGKPLWDAAYLQVTPTIS